MNENNIKNPFKNTYNISNFSYIFNIILWMMKMPLFISLNLLHLIHFLISRVLYFTFLKRYLIRLSSIIVGFLIRIVSGYFYVPIQQKNIKKNEKEKEKINDFDTSEISAGDIIISNYPSYLDLIYLQNKFTPVFFIPKDSKHVEMKQFHQIFFESFIPINNDENNTNNDISNSNKYIENDEAIQIAKNELKCPIILLPEATKTNCSSIIKFNDFEADFENTKVFILGIKHPNKTQNTEPNYVSGSFLKHFILSLGVLSNSLELNFCNEKDVPDFKSDNESISKCRTIISELSGLPFYDNNEKSSNTKLHND